MKTLKSNKAWVVSLVVGGLLGLTTVCDANTKRCPSQGCVEKVRPSVVHPPNAVMR